MAGPFNITEFGGGEGGEYCTPSIDAITECRKGGWIVALFHPSWAALGRWTVCRP
jgi:hypothetical protein